MTSALILSNCCKPKYLTSLLKPIKASHIRRYSFKSVFKMHEAYLWHVEGDETFNFTFRYTQADLNVDRQFNLSRRVNENVDVFLKRVDTNLGKVLDKKKKKRSRKTQEPLETRDNVEEGKIMLLKGENKVEWEMPCSRLIADPRDLFLMIFDEKYVIKFNAPWVTDIELPTCILAGFPVYPSTFDAMYTDKSHSRFRWYRSRIPKSDNLKKEAESWEIIGEGFIYVPRSEDIGCRLRLSCVPGNENQLGPEVQVEGKSTVEAGPGACPFEIRQQFTKNKLSGKDFRITSYNILADTYADSDYSRTVLFPYCPPYALAIDYRKLLIVKELIGYKSDILCLQEVDKKVYEKDIVSALASVNYNGIFAAKGDTAEGLAVFYDQNRFQLLDNKCAIMSKNVDLNESFKRVWAQVQNENTRQRFLDRNTSLLIVTLQSRDNPDEILVVGNTHLYFHPDADHIRLLQGYFALTECQNTVEFTKKMHPDKNVILILSGDFNSSPGDAIYELMTKKYIPEDHFNWKSNPEQIIENVSLSHDLSLGSACGTPEYTNFTVEFADCLDYIFYQTDKLEVTQVVPMPSKEELSLHGAIPSIVFPSDHVAICADLRWTS
ncbi:2',5'-phosphodiesterase 12 [Diachasmimorpha longicaudata]|uniref:2',5'-phosphodiesterase 12 n=1 Tax=Diachasmimorpha longicaudata TaxID=58733 RepID=UPI0030B8F0CA